MFLKRDYILSNELVQKMGINIANISMLVKRFKCNDDSYSIRKLNNCTFINAKARNLPNNIRNGIKSFTFTDISDKLPVSYCKKEFNISEKVLKKAGIVMDTCEIAGKNFYIFCPEFVSLIGNSIPYILNESEMKDCTESKTIQGSIKLNKNKYFTWYTA